MGATGDSRPNNTNTRGACPDGARTRAGRAPQWGRVLDARARRRADGRCSRASARDLDGAESAPSARGRARARARVLDERATARARAAWTCRRARGFRTRPRAPARAACGDSTALACGRRADGRAFALIPDGGVPARARAAARGYSVRARVRTRPGRPGRPAVRTASGSILLNILYIRSFLQSIVRF